MATKSADILEDVFEAHIGRVGAVSTPRSAKVALAKADDLLRRALTCAKRPREDDHPAWKQDTRWPNLCPVPQITTGDPNVAHSIAMGDPALALDPILDENPGTPNDPDHVAQLDDESCSGSSRRPSSRPGPGACRRWGWS